MEDEGQCSQKCIEMGTLDTCPHLHVTRGHVAQAPSLLLYVINCSIIIIDNYCRVQVHLTTAVWTMDIITADGTWDACIQVDSEGGVDKYQLTAADI